VARGPAAVEAAAVGAVGAALGGIVLRPFGAAPAGALVGGLNGLVSGWRGVYDWRRPAGWAAAVLDSTWGIAGTAGALGAHLLAVARTPAGYVADLSHRRNRHVYLRGFAPRRGFVVTVGNVVSNAAAVPEARRHALVERHEDVHVWQSRWFGPAYLLGYGAWSVGGAVVATVRWARRRDEAWFAVVERLAYRRNPFEVWAYAREHRR
jgi:hypothetical protein